MNYKGRSSGIPKIINGVMTTNLTSHDSYCFARDEIDTYLEHWQAAPVTNYTYHALSEQVKQLKAENLYLQKHLRALETTKKKDNSDGF